MLDERRIGSQRSVIVTAFAFAALTAIALVGVLLTASAVDARLLGLVNSSGNPSSGGGTCASCHTVGANPPSLTITGPSIVFAGQTATYTVELASNDGVVAGFNASVIGFAGSLAAAGGDVQRLDRDVTHTSPKTFANGTASFDFTWTAPTVSTDLVVYASGVAANGNGQNGDDATGTTSLPISVTGGSFEVDAEAECADGVGQLAVTINNPFGSLTDYDVTFDGANPTNIRVLANTASTTVISDIADGEPNVTVTREDGYVAYDNEELILCGDIAPVPGADGPIEVAHVVSCLAGNGRVDTNMINTGAATATYRLEFEGLSARALDVDPGDWWRSPITGRPDGDFLVVVKRDGAVVSSSTLTVSCDTAPPTLDEPEIQIVNACRAGNGYILFQFVNDTDQNRPWVILFSGVPNRSTSAAAYAQSVRAVTGRPDGVYEATVTSGGVLVDSFDITVACN